MIYFAFVLWGLLGFAAVGCLVFEPKIISSIVGSAWCVMTAVLSLYRKERR
jgi:hypothetical protein